MNIMTLKSLRIGIALLGLAIVFTLQACSRATDALVVYSGRTEDLIGPLLQEFSEETGIPVVVRYGQTAEMVATILEEGENTPADVIFAQDVGALGALSNHGRLHKLPVDVLAKVEPRFRSPQGQWIGVSGRARTIVYNTDRVNPDDLPATLDGFCEPEWKGRVGWAPANGSFQAHVTALRLLQGEESTRDWLECMRDNQTRVYAKNTPIVLAVIAGEIDAGLVNHYYLDRMQREQDGTLPAQNHIPTGGTLINAAGVGILDTSARVPHAEALARYLLSESAQTYFAEETLEYPLLQAMPLLGKRTPLEQIPTPDVDLSGLEDLEGTLRLLQDTGVL